MKTQALAAVVALVALNASGGLASEGGYDGCLTTILSATTTDFASAARSDRGSSPASDAKDEVARTGKRPIPPPMMIRMALGTDRI